MPALARLRRRAAIGCLVLGSALLLFAVASAWLADGTGETARQTSRAARRYAAQRNLWRTAAVDRLFPPVLTAPGSGPGGTDRTWTRIGTAPDSGDCAATLSRALARRLRPAGCERVVTAAYTDATRSLVVDVGVLTTTASPGTMRRLAADWQDGDADADPALRPRPRAFAGTPAARLTPASLAAWAIRVPGDGPFVFWTAAGFADGRTVASPVPALRPSPTPTPAGAADEAGLTAAARDCGARIEAAWRGAARSQAARPSPTGPTGKAER